MKRFALLRSEIDVHIFIVIHYVKNPHVNFEQSRFNIAVNISSGVVYLCVHIWDNRRGVVCLSYKVAHLLTHIYEYKLVLSMFIDDTSQFVRSSEGEENPQLID